MQPSLNTARKHKTTQVVRRQSNFRAPQVARRGFDQDSGQAFLETEIVFRRKLRLDWISEFRTPRIVLKSTSNANGPRTLFDMAKIKSAEEIRNLTSEHLEHVPWRLAEALWAEIVSRHAESFFGWRLFASQYEEENEFANAEKRYHLEVRDIPLPMKDYYCGLNSSRHDWHVALRISPKQNTIPDLVSVADVSNLAVLDLSDGQTLLDTNASSFDERILRTWAELAGSGRAFSQLRVLMFGWQDHLSGWIFKYLNLFPMLKLVIMTDCSNMHQRNRQEWESLSSDAGWLAHHAKKSAKIMRPLLDDRSLRIGAISALYYLDQSAAADLAVSPESRPKFRPLVECWLGSPRTWTHIIDEFPGTRTIWLERTKGPLFEPITAQPNPAKRVRERKEPSRSPPRTPSRPEQKKPKVRRKPVRYEASNLLAELGR